MTEMAEPFLFCMHASDVLDYRAYALPLLPSTLVIL